MEFIEAHVEVSYGQQWPVDLGNRDKLVAEHIKQTEKELNNESNNGQLTINNW